MQIRLLLLSISFLFCFSETKAQQDKSNYALLWEVSGNGLSSPSYFFGTMHVRDVRAFEFSDSVLLKLDECEAFAMEVNPDTIARQMLEMIFEPDTSDWFSKNLSPEAYAALNESVIKKTGKPLDSLDNQNPFLVEMMLSDFDEPEGTQKKPQVLDLYLSKLAKWQSKPIYGLERLQDYQSLTRSFYNRFEKGTVEYPEQTLADEEAFIDDFIKMYSRGDLDEIWTFMNGFEEDEEHRSEMLDRRNEKMVQRFAAIAKNQSVFCAVGTAHLPGNMGILEILRRRGYTVRKVTPAFTGLAERYSEKRTSSSHWFNLRSSNYKFQVSTPGHIFKPKALKDISSNVIDLHLSIDIYEMNAFFIMAHPSVEKPEAGKELDFYEKFVANAKGENKQEVIYRKEVEADGQKGGEVLVKTEDGYSCWRIFYREGNLQSFCVFREDDLFDKPDIVRFFESIEFFPPEKEQFERYDFDHGAFSVNLPNSPTYQRKEVQMTTEDGTQGEAIIHFYTSFDLENLAAYFVRFNNYPNGIFVQSKKDVHTTFMDELGQMWGQAAIRQNSMEWKGYSAHEALFQLEANFINIRSILRGNRIYLLMLQNPDTSAVAKTRVRDFFNSFEFTPEIHEQFHPIVIPECEVEIGFPGEYMYIPSIETIEFPVETEGSFFALDTLSGLSYSLTEQRWSPYYEISHPDSFYNEFDRLLREDEDGTLANITDTTFMDFRAWDVEYYDETTGLWSNHLMFMAGDAYYELVLYKATNGHKDRAWNYFNSFRPIREIDRNYLERDKTTLIFEDLLSLDTSIMLRAKIGLMNQSFEEQDWPLVYATLRKDIPHDTTEWQTSHELLLEEITNTKDEVHLPFLMELYEEKQHDPLLQSLILGSITAIGEKKGAEFFFEKIPQFRPEDNDRISYYYMTSPFYSRPDLVLHFLPDLMKLRKDQRFQYNVVSLFNSFAQQDSIDISPLFEKTDEFIGDIQRIVAKYSLTTPSDTLLVFEEKNTLSQLLILTSQLETCPSLNAALTELQGLQDPYLLESVASGLVAHGQAVDRTVFEQLASSPVDWYDLLVNFNKTVSLGKIPTDLLQPEKIAEARIANYLYYEYGGIAALEKVSFEKTFTYKENKLRIFAFRFQLEDYEGDYMAICSQPIDGTYNIEPQLWDYSTDAMDEKSDEEMVDYILEYYKE